MMHPRRLMLGAMLASLGVSVPASAQTTGSPGPTKILLGPDAIATTFIPSPRVLFRLGGRSGNELADFPRTMVSLGDSEILVQYHSSNEALVVFDRDRIVRSFGRKGKGPGEYQSPAGLGVTVAPRSGDIWVLDPSLRRAVGFSKDGKPGKVISFADLGRVAETMATFLPDGRLVVNASGSARGKNLGSLIHVYDPKTNQWKSHRPVYRDSVLHAENDPKWVRRLWSAPDGRVLAAPLAGYLIEVLDPKGDFEVEAIVTRRPPTWPEDPDGENVRLSEKFPGAPGYQVMQGKVGRDGLLWVTAMMPEPNWQREYTRPVATPGREGQSTAPFQSDDQGHDTLVEVIDLERYRVVASYRLDAYCPWLLAPGMIGCIAGDDPTPVVDIIELPKVASR